MSSSVGTGSNWRISLSSSDNFSTFLDTTNTVHAPAASAAADAASNSEALTKRALEALRGHELKIVELQSNIGATSEQIDGLVKKLEGDGLISVDGTDRNGTVKLSDFAADALQVFSFK